MNKTIASTLLTGLFVTTCIFTPAAAQEQSLKPQSTWALTKVDRSEQGGNSYCTLSRKYDDNIVLSLGRNQTEEYSLAIDFQKDVFEKDKSVKINLQPGPGQIRAYDMMPTSQKAVVIRLGWDTGFFETLNNSQNMKVKIADKTYSFAMPEVAKGQSDLKGCMEGLQTAAKGEAAPAGPSTDVLSAAPVASSQDFSSGKIEEKMASADAAKTAVAAQEAKVLDDFAKSIKAQENSLREEDKKSFSGKAVAAKKEEPKAEKIAATTPAPVPPKKPVQELVKRPDAADAAKVAAIAPAAGEFVMPKINAQPDAPAVSMMPEPPKHDPSAAKAAADMKALQDRIAKLAKENNTLKQKTSAELQQSNEQVNSLQKRLADISKENETLKQKSATISPETRQKMDAIELEKKALEERLVSAEKEKAQLSVQQVTIADRTKEMETKNAKLEEQLRLSQQKANEAAELATGKSTEQLQKLQTRLAQIAAENQKLKVQSESLSPEAKKQLDLAEAEKAKLQAQIEEASKVKEAAAKAKEAAAKAAEDAKAAQERVAAITKENEALKQKTAGISPEAQKQLEAAEAEKKALQEKLAAAEAAAAAAAKPVAVGITPLPVDPEVESLKAQKTALEEKLAEAEKRAADAAAKPATVVDDEAAKQKISELEIRNKQLEENLRNSQVRIGEAAINTETKALRKIADLEVKLEAAQKDNMSIAKQLESARTQQEDGRLSLVSGDWNLEQATKRFNEAEREIRRLGQDIDKERASCNVEKAKIEQMLFDPAVTEAKQLEKLRTLETQLEEANAKLGERPQVAAAAPADKSVEVQSIEPAAGTANMGEMAWSSKTAKSDLAQEKPSKAMEAENARLRAEAERLRQQLVNAEQGVAQASGTAQAAASRMELDRLRRQLTRTENQNATYQSQLARAQQTPEATPEDHQLLAQRLNSLQPTAGNTQKAIEAKPAAKAETASYGQGNIKTLLQKAGVPASGLTGSGSNYSWNAGAVKGAATVAPSKGFDSQVNGYINSQKGKCDGDFASMPSPAPGGSKKMALYEVACVGASSSTSNSIVFFEDEGKFVAIANQTDAADMDAAMDSRDKIASAVK